MNALDAPIAVTFFKNYAAATKSEEVYTPRSLANRIRCSYRSEQGQAALAEARPIWRHAYQQEQSPPRRECGGDQRYRS